MTTMYDKLRTHLDDVGVTYRTIEHPSAGRTDVASELRGHALEHAAKCMVVEVVRPDGEDMVLAVVPGDRRVDFKRLRRLFGGRDARLASPERAERVTGCRVGCVVPFSFHPQLRAVVDPELLDADEIFFNAARLDRSFALARSGFLVASDADYRTITKPATTERRSNDATDLACRA